VKNSEAEKKTWQTGKGVLFVVILSVGMFVGVLYFLGG